MVPENLKYTESHEWVRVEGEMAFVGITHHAQEQLTDVVYVELPEVGRNLDKGSECAVLESCKIAAEMYSPLTGTVTAVNGTLSETPGLVNSDPYGAGWILQLAIKDTGELDSLMDAAAYQALIGA